MQLLWKVLFLFMLMQAKVAREVNNRFEERNPDSEIHDFFEDETELDEKSPETENDKETEDEFLETEDDDSVDEESDSPESEDGDSEEEKHASDSGRCTNQQLAYFPHRLRDWFYIIKQDLSEREAENEDEDEEILLPLKESEDSEADRKWVEAVLWKFCDLDSEPRDRYLSKEELSSLRNPLVSMEPCIDPFLAGCDSNDDTHVTLYEWGQCLGLKYDEIKDECRTL